MSDTAKKTGAKNARTKTAHAAGAHEFKAETARLLHLLIHSVYSEREVFLRELISNAADACDKLRYEAIAAPELTGDDPAFHIKIVLEPSNGILSVEDNGIGMGRDELIDNLGTIARSGTRAFLDRLAGSGEGTALIGQFGVGFYAAFMVASEVSVISRRAGSQEAWCWRSMAGEGFTVEEVPPADAPSRGTTVRLHLTEEAGEFLEPARIERIVRTYSGHVPVPLSLIEVKEGKRGEEKAIGDATAIWRLPRAEVTEAAYQDFYGHVAGQFDKPALTIHYRAEGRHEYSVLLFLPSMPPFDLFDPERHGRLRLYVRRVFITDQADLLPGYLRFMRGVIDSEDMPLNISREMLQNNPLVAQIRKAVTNRTLSELRKFAEKDADAYRIFWDNFGAVLKEGLYEDMERRDDLYALARFATTVAPEGGRSLADYVAAMKENQTAIYYLTGDDARRLEASPQLEGFRARGLEVLLLTDPIDSFWTAAAMGYDGKPFRSIAQGSADLEAIPLGEERAGEEPPAGAELATLIALLKQTLGEAVSDVVASQRLTESACCLVAPAGGPDRRLEKLLARHGGGQLSAPVLEINPRHALVRTLAHNAAAGGAADALGDAGWLLFDSARIAEGESPQDPAAFCARLNKLMASGLGGAGT